MLITTRCALALCLSAFLAVAAGAQTPPAPSQIPPPGEPQQPPTEPQKPNEPEQPPAEPQQPPAEPEQPPAEPEQPPAEPEQPPAEPQPPPAEPEQPPAEPQQPPAEPAKFAPRSAKTARFFAAANGGYQIVGSKFATSTTFEAFEETATLASNGELKSRPIFDASAGYMVTDKLGVSVGFSYFATKNNVDVVATVPHPLFFDRPRIATYSASGVEHSSPAIHLNAVYFIPFTTKIGFSVSAGPSIVMISQDVITSANLQPETPPFATPNISSVNAESVSKTAFGFNVGGDAVYSLTRRYAAGLTLRYVYASADVEGLTDNLKVSGLQILAGVRVKFDWPF